MDRLKIQLDFIIEIDGLKRVLRRTALMDGSRRENDAEHSWHISVMAMLLQEYAERAVDISKVLRMLLTHDMVEIYAGDTFAYDTEGAKDKDERERRAADRLFGMLPDDQRVDFRSLWDEFELCQTPEAQYAHSMDRLQPLLHNYVTKGFTWQGGDVTSAMVYARMEVIKQNTPELWQVVEYIINNSLAKGYLPE